MAQIEESGLSDQGAEPRVQSGTGRSECQIRSCAAFLLQTTTPGKEPAMRPPTFLTMLGAALAARP